MKVAMKVKVRLFGAFRNFCDQPEIECALESPATPMAVKAEIEKFLKHSPHKDAHKLSSLLAESALANESKVLAENDVIDIHDGMRLAILPPVCGG